jgi:hypothetical protein
MRGLVLLVLLAFGRLHAQWELSVPLVLTGSSGTERQVAGLADPMLPDAALSAAALRHAAANTTNVAGTTQLVGELVPTPPDYATGMLVTVVPDQPNHAGATLNLNGLGDRPILKTGGAPLDSADLQPGVPMTLAYDGNNFRTLGHVPLHCPPGFSAANREYCIADSPNDTASYYNASVRCAEVGARLCTFSEWSYACLKWSTFFPTVLSGEWVDHAANHESTAKVLGYGDNGAGLGSGCTYGSLSVPGGSFRYRCCFNR